MAQYVFDANKYPVGTLLSSLAFFLDASSGAPTDFEVKTIGATGRNYWENVLTPSGTKHLLFNESQTDYEMLILLDHTNAEIGSPENHGFAFAYADGNTGATSIFNKYYNYIDTNNAQVRSIATGFSGVVATDTTPVGLLKTKAMGMRFSYGSSGSVMKARTWAADVGLLEAGEPATWDYEADLAGARLAYPTTPMTFTDDKTSFTVLSLGTGGDSAPYSDPAVTLTQKSVTISDVTDTTATATWV